MVEKEPTTTVLPPEGQEIVAGEKKPDAPLTEEDKEIQEYADSKGWEITEETKPILKSQLHSERKLRETERLAAEKDGRIKTLEELQKAATTPPQQPGETWKDFTDRLETEYADGKINITEMNTRLTGRMMGGLYLQATKQANEMGEVILDTLKSKGDNPDWFALEGFEADVEEARQVIPEQLRNSKKVIENCINFAKGKRAGDYAKTSEERKKNAEIARGKMQGRKVILEPPTGDAPMAPTKGELSTEEKKLAKQMGIDEKVFLERKKLRAEKKHLSGVGQAPKEAGW